MSKTAAVDIADLIREQATAMNMSAANAYDAGLQEGFRRGIARAAEVIENYPHPHEHFILGADVILDTLARMIRALRLKP